VVAEVHHTSPGCKAGEEDNLVGIAQVGSGQVGTAYGPVREVAMTASNASLVVVVLQEADTQ